MQLITKEELADLIFENKESMYRLAYTIVENDAVGDAIVKAFGNIQRLRKKTSAKSWMMQILVNSAHDIVRKRSKWKIVEKQLEDTACPLLWVYYTLLWVYYILSNTSERPE